MRYTYAMCIAVITTSALLAVSGSVHARPTPTDEDLAQEWCERRLIADALLVRALPSLGYGAFRLPFLVKQEDHCPTGLILRNSGVELQDFESRIGRAAAPLEKTMLASMLKMQMRENPEEHDCETDEAIASQ